MREVMSQLESLRWRSRGMLVLQRLAVLVAWTVGVAFALVLFDYALRLPGTFRLFTLITGFAALAYAFWRYFLSAVRFSPTLTQLALRVERSLPSVAGRLASSVEFATAGIDQQNVLAARSVRDAQGRLAGETVRRVLKTRQTMWDLMIMGVVVLVVGGIAAANPGAAQTGITRLLLPYSHTKWPARSGVESLMDDVLTASSVYPHGQALPLRARVTKGDAGLRVTAQHRFQIEGQWESWQQLVLTRQGVSDVHERLVDTNADAIEVVFRTFDDQTEVVHIDLVPPPTVHRALLRVTPPPYASGRVPAIDQELGPGTDGRAVTDAPLLAGGLAEVTLELNKPLPVPADEHGRAAWIERTFDWTNGPLPDFQVDRDAPERWRLRWILDETRRIDLDLEDEHGLRNTEPIAYRIEVVSDAPPSVTITSPQTDHAVLPSARIDIVAEAKDDVSVSHLSLEARDASAATDADHVAPGDPLWSDAEVVGGAAATIERELDLSTLNLRQGDVIELRAIAIDAFEMNGRQHEPSVSPPRRLRIISELEFATQLRRQLSVVRQNAIRMEGMQAELQDAVREDGIESGMERAQARISERIAAERETVDQIEAQLRANRLEDPSLEKLLQQSRDLLDFAGRAANRAVEQLADPGRNTDADADPTEAEREAQRRVVDAQQNVRDELADLIELLDRDEDAWVVTRQLEGLLDEQRELDQMTGRLAERTIGQSLEELSREDRSELERIAQRQAALRDQARELLEDLRQRAESMEEVDPQTASGMRNAANTGEQRELDRDMENAAEQVQQNQLRGAQSRQQAAASTVQRMLQEMQENQRARAEQLLRQLASLIESIDRLIVVQEDELSALTVAMAEEDFGDRDRAMIRLNQNTQAVAMEARAAGQETRRVARSLDRAADAQSAAVAALRAAPLDADAAEEAENRALELLREAKAQAEELEAQTREDETRRQRDELIDAYREMVERQIAVREETDELVGVDELDRRGLVEARRLGNQQDEIREAMDDLEARTSDVMESLVFSHVHRQIGRWSTAVSDELWAGRADRRATELQERIASAIGRLIEALEEQPALPEDFEDGQSGEGGTAGEGGRSSNNAVIPPLAELHLLRGMQEEVYNQTREVDAHEDLNDAQRRERLRDLGQQQRDLLELGRQLLEQMRSRP